MSTDNPSAKATIDRLIELTRMSQLPWSPLYPDDMDLNDYTSDDENFLRNVTMPHGYIVEDVVYGFGLAVLRLKDPHNEEYDPAFYLHGNKLEVSESDLALLRDMIQVFFEDVQQGRAPNQQARMEHMIEAAVSPYAQELERARQQIQSIEALVHKQVEIIDKLSLTTVYASQPRGVAPQVVPGPPRPAVQQPTSSGPVGPAQQQNTALPFTASTLKAALRYVFEKTDDFEQHFSDQRCAGIVQSVMTDFANGNL